MNVKPLYFLLLPTMFLTGVACLLFLLGTVNRAITRRASALIALFSMIAVFGYQFTLVINTVEGRNTYYDASHLLCAGPFSQYVHLLVAAIGILLILLSWPANAEATGNGGVDYGSDAGEFFALMLLAFSGVLLTSIANDLIPFFLGLELASLPTYIMVSISRPTPIAQEAGVKYFFLGALSAALLLLGFSYLYGSAGSTRFSEISDALASARAATGHFAPWQMLGLVLLITGLCFKIAAVPLHMYAGDVYQGAATPVTALLSFVPKATGFVALAKLLNLMAFKAQSVDLTIVKLLWVLAVLTMFTGNLLGLLQRNVKRVMACSSIAHSGYMLAALTIVAGGSTLAMREQGLEGILFYVAAYGMVNVAAFGVLSVLPSRSLRLAGRAAPELADSAETFDDLAGQGRSHVALGLAMAVACFSLIGIPLTIGFLGKIMLIRPAIDAKFYWLVVFTVANAAISAAYYLRIVGTMFLSPDPVESRAGEPAHDAPIFRIPASIAAAVAVAVVGTLVVGIVPPASDMLDTQAKAATDLGYVPHPILADRGK